MSDIQELLMSANENLDQDGVGIKSKKYDVGRGSWSEESPVHFYNIGKLKDYTPRQLESYIYKHTSNHFLHRYNIKVSIDDNGKAFLKKVSDLIEQEREKNPIISEIVAEGDFLDGEKVDLKFTDDIKKIAQMNLKGLRFYEQDYKGPEDTYTYEVKDGKDYEYVDNANYWTEIEPAEADNYYSMVRTQNNDWFYNELFHRVNDLIEKNGIDEDEFQK